MDNFATQSRSPTYVGAQENPTVRACSGQGKTKPVADVPHQPLARGRLHSQFIHAP